MVNHTALKLNNGPYINESTQSLNYTSLLKSKNQDGPFVWDKSIQGWILSAFFYGYIILQIPGGWLSFRFGCRKTLSLSMGIGSALTILIPVFARIHHWALFTCLFFVGAAHSSFWPSASSFWAYWAPESERSLLIGTSSAGSRVGNIITLSLGGILCVYGIDGGWPSIFYLFGSCGVVWSVLFFVFSADEPSTHWFIGNEEKKFIVKETEKTIALRNYCQKNGLISTIPYIASSIMISLAGLVADLMIKNTKMSRTCVRRVFNAIGLFLPALFVILLSFVSSTQVATGIALLTTGVAIDSVVVGGGYYININDVSGPYAGIVLGISNTVSTLPGIISPKLASAITKHGYQSEWQIVFIICAVIYVCGGILSVILLSGDIEPWAKIDESKMENKSSTDVDEVAF